MMKSLLIAGAVTAAASANDIDLFATSSWDDSSYLMQQAGYWNPAIEGWVGGPVYVGVNDPRVTDASACPIVSVPLAVPV